MKTRLTEIEWDLIISFLSGEASASEERQLNEILLNSEKKQYFEDIKRIWETTPQALKYDQFNSESALDKLQVISDYREQRYSYFDYRISVKAVLKVAAILVLIIGALLSWLLLKNNTYRDTGFNTIAVRYGEQSHITLSDGTNVWLNSGSKLTYPTSFNGKTRDVMLEGEAYFDVAHNKNKLFIVNTSKVRIKVLGTAFNVKSYPGDNKIETTLVRGSVVIEKTGTGKTEAPVVLKPGERATYSFNDNIKPKPQVMKNEEKEQPKIKQVAIARVDPSPITSWKEKALVFDNTSMEDIAVILERWFGTKVHLADDTLRHYRYKGRFTHNETIFQVLEVIKITSPVNYEYKDHEITMTLLK